ncbi:DUF2793 domain-containing protein [Bowmanella yangjiangensis]|uniref:DUF2793 domain-containing protein n=1 Tax=Bowmanella yangjiangensis TaxID=2811230 RepID=A0ABS3CZ91_9ALTE|nr:DUF2793 domain-containing protein [Bowmanella yangjiangensis]MBN7822439.1 DUF2793 domain-containing protein [Bowmanella yangjiangensis]
MSSANNNITFVPENTIDPAAGLNESISIIDALLQIAVVSVGDNTPPVSPASGARYIVGTAPTGAWAGQANKLARWLDSTWTFFDARYAVNLANVHFYVRGGAGWVDVTAAGGGMTNPMTTLGDLILGGASGAPTRLAIGAATYVLTSNGTTAVWQAPTSGGMTNPMTTEGDIIVGGASGAPARLAIGAEGQVAVVRSGVLVYEDQAGGTVPFAPVLTESTTSRTLSVSDAGDYVRFTNAGASTCTVAQQSSEAWAANTEVHIRVAPGGGNLTLTPGSGVTLNTPSGGTLVMSAGMSVTLKRVAEDEWDVIGQTVAA